MTSIPTEISPRRWDDLGTPSTLPHPMRGFAYAWYTAIFLIIGLGVAGASTFVTTTQHTWELTRQAQLATYNEAFTKRVCEMYQHRDSAVLAHNAMAVALNNKFAAQLPKGYAAALNGMIAKRETDLFTIEKVDCGSSPPTPAPAPPFTTHP